MDGARIFNAATYLQLPAKEIAKYTDSVMFCYQRLMCSCGFISRRTSDFIQKARKYRKMLGGGLRQGGFGSWGIVALER